MEPLFSEKQLQDMSKENIIALVQAMQAQASVLSRSSHRFRYAGIPSNSRTGRLR